MFSIIPDLTRYNQLKNMEKINSKSENKDKINSDQIKAKMEEIEQANQLKSFYKSKINELNDEIKQIDLFIDKCNKIIEDLKKKPDYFKEIQTLFRNKYGNEPYLDAFIEIYNELSKSKNVTIEIIKDKTKRYVILVDAGGITESEKRDIELLKNMFNHIILMLNY